MLLQKILYNTDFFFINSDLMIFGFYPAEVCQMFVMAAVKVMAVKNYKNAYNENNFLWQRFDIPKGHLCNFYIIILIFFIA